MSRIRRITPTSSIAFRVMLTLLLTICLIPTGAITAPVAAYADDGAGAQHESIMDFIENNADEELVPADEPDLFSFIRAIVFGEPDTLEHTEYALVVKNTVIDTETVGEATFDNVFKSEDSIGDAIVAQYSHVAEVFDPGEDSDYYVAFADTAEWGGAMTVGDWVFARYNMLGETIDDMIYEPETGIIYIPKHLYQSDEDVYQIQFLCSYDFDTDDSSIDVRVENNSGTATALYKETSIDVSALDVSFDIPLITPDTAASLCIDDMEVYLNGASEPVSADDGNNLVYDSSTGVLSIRANPSTVGTVDIVINHVDSTPRAHAISVSSMGFIKDLNGNESILKKIDPDGIKKGDKFQYWGMIQYFSGETENNKQYKDSLTTLWDSICTPSDSAGSAVHNAIINGSTSFNFANLISPKAAGKSIVLGDTGHGGWDIVEMFTWPNKQYSTTETNSSGGALALSTAVVGGQDWSGWPKTTDGGYQYCGVGRCAHVTIGSSSWLQMVPDPNPNEGRRIAKITMTILEKGDDYLVCGFVTPTMNTQSAAAVFKIRYQSYGWIEIQKKSDDETTTSSNSRYSLKGAKYGIYSDSACTKKVETLTTNSKGYAKSGDLTPGKYYVKEISAPDGFKIDTKAHSVTVESDKTSEVSSIEKHKTGKVKLQKTSAIPDWTNGNSYYSFEGAQYQVRNSSNVLVATITTNANGYGATGDLPLGKYTVKESVAPKGYRLDPNSYTVDIKETDNDSDVLDVTANIDAEQPNRGKISLQKKTSALTTMDYDTYSLSKAKYQIIDDKGKIWETLTTDEEGKATSADLPLGHYIVKETVPPEGYDVDITPENVTITEDKSTNGATSIDGPTVTTDEPKAEKQDVNIDAVGTDSGVQGGAELVDATYKLSYYDGYYTSFDQINKLTPKKTSTMVTKLAQGLESGKVTITPEQANMDYDGNGKYFLPLGTYKLEEIEAPEGYHLEVNQYMFQCRYDENRVPRFYLIPTSDEVKATADITAPLNEQNLIITRDAVKRGDLSIMKYIEDTTDPDKYPDAKRPCAGVKFRIINNNDYPVLNVLTGKAVPKGEVVYELTTNAEGYASTRLEMTEAGQTGILNNYDPTGQSPNALAYGNYIIEEDPTTTPEGYVPIKKYQDVSINANNRYVHVIFENKTGTVVRVNKIDNETKLNVRGITKFEILDSDMNVMQFKEPYPSNAVISMFETGIDGSAVIPEKLLKGTYYIREVEAADGYLYSDALIPFEINSSTVNDYDHPYDVYFGDNPAKGRIILTKRDADTFGPIVYSSATYEIRAAEDIVTQDTTIRALKGELVDTVTTGPDGTAISKELFLGRYIVTEVDAPDNYLLDSTPIEVTLEYEGDRVPVVTENVDVTDAAQLGYVEVEKIDADSKQPVKYEGAVFDIRAVEDIIGGDGHVWYHKGEVVDTVTTDANGKAASSKALRFGQYEIVEKVAPYGYILDPTPVPFELTTDDQTVPTITMRVAKENHYSPTDVELVKLDRETARTVMLPGCEIDIYANDNITTLDGTVHYVAGEYVGTVRTDESGKVVSNFNMPVGKYKLRERTAPTGYVLDAVREYAIETSWDGGSAHHIISMASISDMPSKGIITFTKADAETGQTIPVAGIKAQVIANEDIITGDGTVRAHKDEVVANLVTDVNGFAQTGELYLGSYRVVEVLAPEGYLINETPVNVELVYAGQNIPVITCPSQIFDENAKGIIEITKVDRETGNVIPLAGTQFEIRAKGDIVTADGTVRVRDGELACEVLATNADGKCASPELYLGTYSIIEVRAPEGYVLDSTPIDAVIAYKDQHTAIVTASSSVSNIAQKGIIKVTKTDIENGLPVLTPGAKFDIVAVDDIVTADGTLRVRAGDVAASIETDSTGIAESPALYLGKYSVREAEAPTGYLLSDGIGEVELVYGEQTESLVYGSSFIADKSVVGTIIVHKEDSDNQQPLTGVVYEIRAKEDIVDGTGVVRHRAGDVVDTITTNDEGIAESRELVLGKYVVIETVQPNGYELDETGHDVALEYADQVTPVVHADAYLTNTPSTVVIKKVSTEDPDTAVPGTEFIGWNANDELATEATFAVFAVPSCEILSASVDYRGALDAATGADNQTAKSFELARIDTDGTYSVWASNEALEQGNYILHLSYIDHTSGRQLSEDIEFSVNEHDTNAFFAIGTVNFDDTTSNHMYRAPSSVEIPQAPETEPVPDENGENTEVPPTGEIEEGAEMPLAGENAEGAETPSAGENNDDMVVPPADENAGVTAGNEEEAGNAPDGNTAFQSQTGNTAISRVPVILKSTSFAYSVTGEDGTCEFKYVPQGKIGFAEYKPAAGYVSDRTPQYAVYASNGRLESTGSSDGTDVQALAEGGQVLGLVYADDLVKLQVSKRDVTNEEELPGNVLSVYKAKTPGKANEDEDIASEDYGELVETWTSTNEPHMMELIPQGTYILKEEQAVEGYTIANDIKFQVNDTGVVQQVVMHNEHESGVADELITENPLPLGQLILTGDMLQKLLVLASIMAVSAFGVVFVRWHRRQ